MTRAGRQILGMAPVPPHLRLATHEVANQPPDLIDSDLFATDPALCEAAQREGGAWTAASLSALGAAAGRAEMRDWAEAANRHPPELLNFDRWGRRLDEVRFHPSYHALMREAAEHRIAALAWAPQQPGSHVAHAAALALFSQVEQGVMCPFSMTYAAVPVLRQAGTVGEPWVERILASRYDAPLRPVVEKAGIMVGMAMTEKQGGSDLRATQTRAEPDGAGAYRLTGHKWFCSAPMSDGFLTLAQAPGGLTCFLVPRVRPDGARNAIHLMRLKDKLGNRSNASAEIEYHGAFADRIGDEGRGIATILRMVHHTRLDCMASSLGIMRAALAQAAHHATYRLAFGRPLIAQPAMAAVLADLQLDYEAAIALTTRVARALDGADGSEAALARLGVAIGKFFITKGTPGFVMEAMECLGGAGYIEEGPMPRLYREAPVNAIWEGSGNVVALDLLRTLGREPAVAEALQRELEAARGVDRRFDAALAEAADRLVRPAREEEARHLAASLAVLWSAALLLRHAPVAVADAYCATRLCDARRLGYGDLPGCDVAAILRRIGTTVAAR